MPLQPDYNINTFLSSGHPCLKWSSNPSTYGHYSDVNDFVGSVYGKVLQECTGPTNRPWLKSHTIKIASEVIGELIQRYLLKRDIKDNKAPFMNLIERFE